MQNSGRIKEISILHVGLPLRKRFRHALYSRSQSDSIFLKILLDDGTAGYGESLPREYVTGETPASVIEDLRYIAENKTLGYAPQNYKEVISFVKDLGAREGAARCAIELALLDAYGRYFKSPVSALIGKRINDAIVYSGVIQAGSIIEVVKTSLAFRIFGLNFIKLKVGMKDDIIRLKVARSILGRRADIRVDANCAWNADEAVKRIERMRRFNISAVEQPVGADDYAGLKKVKDAVKEPIIADESLCTIDDAQRLAKQKACSIFNIRLSKCGGLLNSLEIAEIARRHNIGIQLGCQVGESGLLSAAGWHFASTLKDISFYEGSYGRYLLKEDTTREDITIGRGGRLRPINGPGLGVNIREDALNKYAAAKEVIKR